MKRAVITGMGAITPLGVGAGKSWKALLSGTSAIAAHVNPSAQAPSKWPYSAQVNEFDDVAIHKLLGRKNFMRYDRFVLMALVAAQEATAEAGLSAGAELSRAAVVMGSSRGGLSTLEKAMQARASAFLMSGTTISMAASRIAQEFKAGGHISGISNACASGANAIGEAIRLIRDGRADIVIAGGAEAPLTPICFRGYGATGALSKSGVMRPFDSRRDGFVLAEGAACLIMEEYEHARNRGANIYAEVAGYGNTSDAHHPTEPLSEGQWRATQAALDDAGMEAADVDYISAHATATTVGDRVEAKTLENIFPTGMSHVSAIKSMTGHMLAAASAFEVLVAVKCLHEGKVPPTIHATQPQYEMNISPVQREANLSAALCNSFGFGGVNVVLALKAIN